MSKRLKQDICGVGVPSTHVANIETSTVKKSLPPEVQYACLYWVRYLERSGTQLYDQVYQFLQDHLLHWLEALGWMRKTFEGILAIVSLEALILVSLLYNILRKPRLIYTTKAYKSPTLHAFVHDAKRFAIYNRPVIERTPLQLYCSGLIFASEKSIV